MYINTLFSGLQGQTPDKVIIMLIKKKNCWFQAYLFYKKKHLEETQTLRQHEDVLYTIQDIDYCLVSNEM